MPPLPPLTLTFSRHSTWNAAVCALAALASAVATAWAVMWAEAIGTVQAAGLAVLGVVIAWLAGGLLIRRPMNLAWDTSVWRLGAGADLAPVDCRVVLDLGPWMLLQCRGEEGTRWLPVSRAQAPADWHSLRCAVHAPRPAPVHDERGVAVSRP